MSLKLTLLVATVSVSVLFLNVSTQSFAQTIPYWDKQCRKLFEEYTTEPGHKAFAVFSNQLEENGCAYTYRAGSKAIAEKQAIQNCGKLKPSSYMGTGISRRCSIYKSE